MKILSRKSKKGNVSDPFALLSYAELIGRRMDGVNVTTNAAGQQVVTGGQDDNTLTVTGGSSILSGGRGNDRLTGVDVTICFAANDALFEIRRRG